MLTSGTDLDNEMRCAAAVRAALGTQYGSPAQVALRFALGNHDVATRVIGVGDVRDLEEALKAVEAGPLPTDAVDRLEGLWATDFTLGRSVGTRIQVFADIVRRPLRPAILPVAVRARLRTAGVPEPLRHASRIAAAKQAVAAALGLVRHPGQSQPPLDRHLHRAPPCVRSRRPADDPPIIGRRTDVHKVQATFGTRAAATKAQVAPGGATSTCPTR